MKLIVKELKDPLDQELQTPDKPMFLYAIRPHLYRHNFPAGSLTVQILDTNKKLVGESETLNISEIDMDDGSAPNNFYHGYVRFLIDTPLQSNTIYWIRLNYTGYSFSESAYIGWCTDWEHRKYDADYTANSGFGGALDMEIWTRVRRTRSE